MRTFHLLVANTLVASVTNNFLWFALTFWVYLETRSVLATAIIGGGYMLLVAVSGMFFGTFVDRHLRRTRCCSRTGSRSSRSRWPASSTPSRRPGRCGISATPAFWALITLLLVGAIAGNLRIGRPVDHGDPPGARGRPRQANGLVGTANGVAFAITSVFSGLAIGLLGMGGAWPSRSCSPRSSRAHLLTI